MEFKLPGNRHFLFFFCFIASHLLNKIDHERRTVIQDIENRLSIFQIKFVVDLLLIVIVYNVVSLVQLVYLQ